MNFSKEKLLSVVGLEISDIIKSMNDDEFDEYCDSLMSFIETLPMRESELKNSFAEMNYEVFSKTLSRVQNALKRIHANGLNLSCSRLLDELGHQKYKIVEAHLTYLLAEIAGLSIDIQMAQNEEIKPQPIHINPPHRVIASDTKGSKQLNILAVDDVSLLLFELRSTLQNTEYKFTGVTSGEAALRYVEKHTPDLFILDIEMPEMNGYELTTKLRALGQTAPVIFLTGNASVEYVRKALEVGAADFIVKPINKEQVMEKILKHLGW